MTRTETLDRLKRMKERKQKQELIDAAITTSLKENQLYNPGDVPPHWKNVPIMVIKHAITFGLLIPEYTALDYIERAIETQGYETIEIWGVQGAAKSNRTLQIAYWIFEDWDLALKSLVFLPDAHNISGWEDRGFLQRLKSIQHGKRTPFLGWDDLTVHFTSSSWRTNIQQYEAVDAAWAAVRTKISVTVVNNPIIDRVPRNIKDNITIEFFIGRNQVEMIERCIRLPGLKQIESNFFKIQVEPLHRFNIYDVPTDVFKEYHELRLQLAEQAIKKMGKAFGDEADILEDMVTINQILTELPISPTSLNDMLKRNFIPNEKINGRIFVAKKDYEQFKQHFLNHTSKTHKKK